MLAKPCSSKVRESEAMTSRSTTRAAGSSSGNPLSGVGLAFIDSKSSGGWTCGTVLLQLEQEGVGRALATDGRLLTMTRQHHDVVGQREDLLGEAAQHRRVVAPRQVG